jgi:tRNA (adenine22-N1)-methyltransferase
LRNIKSINIDERLRAIAGMIRGDVITDVGSDHAYLPVWLYLNGRIKKAYASDISENCVNRIRSNIAKYNISEEIIVPVLSDGLTWLEAEPCGITITDVIIAGMGGMNIAGILEKSPLLKIKKGGVNYILQPNRKADYLRAFLRENNFDITREITVESKRRTYTIINAINAVNAGENT